MIFKLSLLVLATSVTHAFFPAAPSFLSVQKTAIIGGAHAFFPAVPPFLSVQKTAIIGGTTALRALVKDVSADELEVILETVDGPTIIDAYALWCGPCQILKPELESAMSVLTEKGVKAYSFDTDKYEEFASRLRVMGLPTLYFFTEGGVLLRRIEGAYNKAELIKLADEIFFAQGRDTCRKGDDEEEKVIASEPF